MHADRVCELTTHGSGFCYPSFQVFVEHWWRGVAKGIVFTNADPRYSGKLDDPQGGDAALLMQQVREVMTVNQLMSINW